MTTEVAIRVRATEDVYVVLTGYDLESQLANFRVYINPLILWVWIGFSILAFGTLVCLIPQGVVDRLQWKPKTRLGRAADVGILVADRARRCSASRPAHASAGRDAAAPPSTCRPAWAWARPAAATRRRTARQRRRPPRRR